MSASPSLSGVATAVAPAPAPAKPRARGFLHIVRYGAGPGSVYVLTYHRLERIVAPGDSLSGARRNNGHRASGHDGNGNQSSATDPERAAGVLLSVAKDPVAGAVSPENNHRSPEPDARPKPVVAEGAQALIDLLERIGVDFHLSEVRGALEDILRLGSANIPDLWLSDDDLFEKGLAES